MSLKRFVYALMAAGMLLLGGVAARGDDASAEINASDIKKPGDFAPREQRVSVRNAQDYRSPEGILAKAAHEPVKVDANVLHKRILAMYDGTSFSEGLTGRVVGNVSALNQLPPPAAPLENSHVWGSIIMLAIPVILLGAFLLWWQRQAKFAVEPRSQIVRLRNDSRRRGRSPAAKSRKAH